MYGTRKSSTGKDRGGNGKKTMEKMGTWQCTECDNACTDDGDIECFVCKNWTHKKCANIKEDMYETLSLDNVQWICSKCLKGKKEVQTKTDAQLEKLLDLVPLVHSLKTKLEKIEEGLGMEKLEEKVEEVVDRKLAEALEEQNEIEKRKDNIIIVNMRESDKTSVEERKQDDLAQARTILGKLTKIVDDGLTDPVRLGKIGGNRPRMLRVSVKSIEKKKEIIKKAHEINVGITDKNKRIYINPDLTPKQREKNRELRAELSRRVQGGEVNLAIRGGKIVTWKKQDRQRSDEQGKGGKDDE